MLNSKEFVRELQLRHESARMNPNVGSAETALAALPLTRTDVDDAEARLERFAPFIKKVFPETAADRGLIESPLTEIEHMRAWLNENEGAQLAGKLFLKRDSDLPVAGSVKARGGCYAVLKHTEDLALANRLVETRDDYSVFATRAFRNFFSQYELHVGSTGNLGLSIGIMGAALGYRVTVHMSADARQWKKDLLRAKGVTVLEYGADYSYAVQKGASARRRTREAILSTMKTLSTSSWATLWLRGGSRRSSPSRTSRWTTSTRCSFTFPAVSAARRAVSALA